MLVRMNAIHGDWFRLPEPDENGRRCGEPKLIDHSGYTAKRSGGHVAGWDARASGGAWTERRPCASFATPPLVSLTRRFNQSAYFNGFSAAGP